MVWESANDTSLSHSHQPSILAIYLPKINIIVIIITIFVISLIHSTYNYIPKNMFLGHINAARLQYIVYLMFIIIIIII